ncbi:MAG: hypothetical protein VKL39_01815 [Leptolyngbyaceae bacterium]|nr:hypothetical protein [Leptolyngbyaceae bacterium]
MMSNWRWMQWGTSVLAAGLVSSIPAASVAQTSTSEFLQQMETAFSTLDPNQLILLYGENASLTRINNGLSYSGSENILDLFTTDLNVFQQLTVRYGEAQTIPLNESQVLLYAPLSATGTSDSGSIIQFDGGSTFVLEALGDEWLIVREHSNMPFPL